MFLTALSLSKTIASLPHRLEVIFAFAGELTRRGQNLRAAQALDCGARLILLSENLRSRVSESLTGWALKRPTGSISEGWMTVDIGLDLDRIVFGETYAGLHTRLCTPTPSPLVSVWLNAEADQLAPRDMETAVTQARDKSQAGMLLSCAKMLAPQARIAIAVGQMDAAFTAVTLLCSIFDEMTWEREENAEISEVLGICLAGLVVAHES